MIWKEGDRCQVRDRRDGAIAIARATVTGFVPDPDTVYVREDGTSFQCGVPAMCVEPIGQKERNRRP